MTSLNYKGGTTPTPAGAAFSIPSIIAAVCAILTFTVNGAGTRLFVAILAAVFGLLGVVISLLPGKRGGIVSILSIFIGGIAFIVAIVQAINGRAS